MLFNKNIKLRRRRRQRRRKRRIVGAVSRYLAKAAEALVISEPMAIRKGSIHSLTVVFLLYND